MTSPGKSATEHTTTSPTGSYPHPPSPSPTRPRGYKIVHRAYKTELKLNNRQRTLCRKYVGCARFAYNWGLRRKIAQYQQTGKSPNAIALHRELNRLKPTDFPWMYEVSKCAPQEALRNLDQAFANFYRRLKNGGPPGFPKFKSRKRGSGSFRLTGRIRVFPHAIQLPRLGRLRLKEQNYLPSESDQVHILSATLSEQAGRWFVSLLVREALVVPENRGPVVGVDLGLQRLVVVSDGTVHENPRALFRFERKLKRVQQSLARKRRGSRNRRRTVRRLQRLHRRITNIRRDALHKVTSMLARTKAVIVVEDLNVAGMKQHPHLAKAVADVGFFEFRRQLIYKTKWYGSQLLVAPRFYPSSKWCSQCGEIKEHLALSVRVFVCNRCGVRLDRDVNASYNLVAVAVSCTETLNAWREAGGDSPHGGQCPSMMQEPNTIQAAVLDG
jgi:putative transposase